MEWNKPIVDSAIVILGVVIIALIWPNNISKIKHDINDIKNELAIIKTVLVMKQIMPCELAKTPTENLKHVEKQ